MTVRVELKSVIADYTEYKIITHDNQSITLNADELYDVVSMGKYLLESLKDIQNFVEKWNDLDIIISSMDIDGNNVLVVGREMILDYDTEKVVCVVKDEIANARVELTAKELIKHYLDGSLKVFQEVPYI